MTLDGVTSETMAWEKGRPYRAPGVLAVLKSMPAGPGGLCGYRPAGSRIPARHTLRP